MIDLGSTIIFTAGKNKGIKGKVVKIEKEFDKSVHRRCFVKVNKDSEYIIVTSCTSELSICNNIDKNNK